MIAIIVTFLIVYTLTKYRKCKLDTIYYLLLGIFELIMILKIITSIIEIYSPKKTWASGIFNGVVITASYTSILCGMQLFIFELDRMI